MTLALARVIILDFEVIIFNKRQRLMFFELPRVSSYDVFFFVGTW